MNNLKLQLKIVTLRDTVCWKLESFNVTFLSSDDERRPNDGSVAPRTRKGFPRREEFSFGPRVRRQALGEQTSSSLYFSDITVIVRFIRIIVLL